MQSFRHYMYLYEWDIVRIWHPHGYMDIEKLVERARAKEPQALETIYKMYFPKMMGLCIKITKENEDTAKDLVHDAFVLAFSSLHNLNHPERIGEWLSTIVRNVALRYMDRKGKISFVSITDADDNLEDTDATPDAVANLQDILELIDRLPNGYGKVFRLYTIEGFSHNEIADILGIEPHSSSSQLSRARAMLRKMMDRRLLAVVLLLIAFMPLYFFVMRDKPTQEQKQVVADRKPCKHGEQTNRMAMRQDARDDIRKPTYNNVIVPDVVEEQPDTTYVPDTVIVDIPVPEVQMAEQDSIGDIDSIMPLLPLPEPILMAEVTGRKSRKWQMLAAGSLGPALAQNIYRMIAAETPGDIASGAPTGIGKWEEYSQYLNDLRNDNMPKDSLALIDIANNNHGDIITQEQHDRPITFGISLNKSLSERWSIETGLQYSILKSRSIMGNEGYYIGEKQNICYVGIPLRLSFCLADCNRLSLYSSTGVSLNIPVYGKVNSKYVVAGESAYMDSWHITPPVQWSANFSLGLQYRILPKLALHLEPTLYWYIPNDSSTHTIWTEHPIIFSAPFGIRFTW